MKSTTSLGFVAALVALVAGQTLYLAGDSTMADLGADEQTRGLEGWGVPAKKYFTIPVVNKAIAGRSARSYTEQGDFKAIINAVKPGDFVVIEFGHNDRPVPAGAPDNGRQDAVGSDYATTATVKTADGRRLVIHTFNYYIQNAVNALKTKGAIPIISALTPRNVWENGTVVPDLGFRRNAAAAANRTGVTYINHYEYTARAYDILGRAKTNTFFPKDGTHTNAAGADVVAQTFVRGLLCSDSALKSKVNTTMKLDSATPTC